MHNIRFINSRPDEYPGMLGNVERDSDAGLLRANAFTPISPMKIPRSIRFARYLPALRRGIAGLTACCLLAACTTTRTYRTTADLPIAPLVRIHDTVKCTLRDGTSRTFVVVAVEPAALVGEKERVVVTDLVRLEVTRFSAGKTIVLTAILVAGVVVAVVANAGFGIGGGSWSGAFL